jgi:hypothetical protein
MVKSKCFLDVLIKFQLIIRFKKAINKLLCFFTKRFIEIVADQFQSFLVFDYFFRKAILGCFENR